ncbi:MAG: sigma-54-dependent Fis family transcriptional regulator [Acidobacteria bacterium]|nr:sigma-54-dependent Fis family transcriptional regulator [Acidobacteriota bacterium]
MIRLGLCSEDRALQPLLSSALGKDFEVTLVASKNLTDENLSSGICDVLLLDIDSPENINRRTEDLMDRCVASQIPVVIMASDVLRSTAVELVRKGAYGYCRRPPSIRELKTMLIRAYESLSLRRKLLHVQQLQEAPIIGNKMIGSSPQMQQIYDLMRRVTNINASVLVTGETGTGKELIANGIHCMGLRADRPFVAVSCGAIPESLIEAELFGHEKGAFTGTVGSRIGYLEQAGDGTLFLDEIGELSLLTQVKLLRVLQQREFCRLGSNRLIPLRARVILATHQNLADRVAQGTFRQDLYYRINVMRIDALALREHPEDVPQIARHFLKTYAAMYQIPVVEIHVDAIAALQSYSWPGNVRELENVIQRAIIIATSDTIRLEDLPPNIQEESAVISIDDYQPGGSFERQLREYKVKLATNALRDHHGNKTLAARSLNISRAYLHRLIRVADPEILEGLPIEKGAETESA